MTEFGMTAETNANEAQAEALPQRLEVGQIAPDFTLNAIAMPGDGTTVADGTFAGDGADETAEGVDPIVDAAVNPTETTVTLSDLTARGKRVILYFYPAAMTPGCTTEACDFRDNIARLGTLGYTVIGVSKDSIDKLRRFAERDHLPFLLLSDPDLAVHRAYGAYGEKKLYGKTHVGVLRSTFAIDADGRILLARYNVRAKGHVESLMKALAKLD